MNEATLRRLQKRMGEEGLKAPSDTNSVNNEHDDPTSMDPADCNANAPNTIYTAPKVPSAATQSDNEQQQLADYERQIEQQRIEFERLRFSRGSGSNSDNEVNEPAAQQGKTQLEGGPSEDSASSSSVVDELEKCEHCGYDSPLMHRFCGNCGAVKPEDWWCTDCHYENSAYHRFCGMCGVGNPADATSLGYEDVHTMGLNADDEAAIQDTAARMSQHITVPPPGGSQWDEDDALTFADDASEAVGHHASAHAAQHLPPQPQEQQQKQSDVWNCEVCTFLNQNPMFMCCEMCGSARPAAPGAALPELLQKKDPLAAPDMPSNAPSEGESGNKKKEKRITDRLREQQLQQFSQQRQAQGGANQQQTLPEPETDHELALIYAQQERMLAQYQQQQLG